MTPKWIHTAKVSDAVFGIGETNDLDQLDTLEDDERAHPDFEGGRKSVLAAIEARRRELEAGASDGEADAGMAGADAPVEDQKMVGGMLVSSQGKVPFRDILEEDEAPPPFDPVDHGDWIEDRWAGHPHFSCKHCSYETLEADEMATHSRRTHPERWRRHRQEA